VEPFIKLLHRLLAREVRFLVVGVSGANLYTASRLWLFVTAERHLFLPPEPENLIKVWAACKKTGLSLRAGERRLRPTTGVRLAERIVANRALTRACGKRWLTVDLSLVMEGFEFEQVWKERREFVIEGMLVPVARLRHIVDSKALAGTPMDRLFVHTHDDMLCQRLAPPPRGWAKLMRSRPRPVT
jgi:hypothetical protein